MAAKSITSRAGDDSGKDLSGAISTPELIPDAVRAELERILVSPEFVNADRIQRFPRFVVEETLAGRAGHLKGYTLAIEVFDRDASFDPNTDPIVRVEAGRLRRRLEKYYLSEGRDNPIHIEIPKGRYAPTIQARVPSSDVCAADDTAAAPATPPSIDGEQRQVDASPTSVAALSLAVLPFQNLSDESQRDSFCDGLTEEVITGLARVPALSVIARITMLQHHTRAVDVRQLGGELAVRYVLQGSMRLAGQRLRITAQLIDVSDGAHVWADNFDCELTGDEIALQQDLTEAIVTALAQRFDIRQTGGSAQYRQPVSASSVGPERRQVTVLFCDLVGTSEWSGTLDPEDFLQAIQAYHAVAKTMIERYRGVIAGYIGNGLIVYFGFPQAHEDDAERAARAGLDIVHTVTTLRPLPDLALQVSVGIATGEMVISSSKEQLVGGEPSLAMDLQALAEPNSVVIGPRTYRLAGGAFEYIDLGTQSLKAIVEPVHIWQVVGARAVASRFEAASTAGNLTPLVGREQEIALLQERWRQATDGDGQVVLLIGEPGIGKSRVAQTLRERLAEHPHTQMRYQCSPYHANSALYPVIRPLERASGFQRDDRAEVKLDKLEALLAQTSDHVADVAPLFAKLLSLPPVTRYPPLALSAERQKERLLEALVEQASALAAQQPLLVILEDAHWIDPTTSELLDRVIDQAQNERLLLLITARPEFASSLDGYAHLTTLTLNRLGRHQCEVLIDQLTQGKPLPDEVRQQILSKTDGIPLFVEEASKMVLGSRLLQEHGDRYTLAGSLPSLAVPATLADSLTARLDQLGPVKDVAQTAAVVGREFTLELLTQVSSLSEPSLRDALGQLVDTGLILRRRGSRQSYVFKHALVQEAAYQQLLRSSRQQLHARIAQALETKFQDTHNSEPELLAQHYTGAGLTEAAIKYWLMAGRRAMQQSANAEAVHHLNQALEILGTLPVTQERHRQEIELQLTLGSVYIASRGFGAPETARAFNRAREICKQFGDSPELVPSLVGVADVHFVRGELKQAREISDECQALAERSADSDHLVKTHNLQGFVLFGLGKINEARSHLEQCLQLYDPERHSELASRYGYDPAVDSLGWLSWILWLQGYPDQALAMSRQALRSAQKLSHPQSLALAKHFTLWVHAYRREPKLVLTLAETQIASCAELGFPFFLAAATALRGWSLSELGEVQEGIAEMSHGITLYRDTGTTFSLVRYLGLLARGFEKAGEVTDGLGILGEALALVEKNNERYFDAELHRLQGELLLAQDAAEADVESCYDKALILAREQGLKSLQLRSALSLSRFWRNQHKKKKARELLSQTYEWFGEGFETSDLQEAKVLLDELA
ncbi:MAG: AAA family ATPase [Gammaproteobacteria bacterium]